MAAVWASAGASTESELFRNPPKRHYPETWFHFISGNVSKEGITADLEAIAAAGFSGVQLFHGHFNDNVWPGVTDPIKCLGPKWNDAVRHTSSECRRLGLRFTMQNCPGWAMAGGPWIEPEHAMRSLVMSRTDIKSDGKVLILNLPQPEPSGESWRDYRDIAVLAFPTPAGEALPPFTVTATDCSEAPWASWLGGAVTGYDFAPAEAGVPHRVEIEFDEPATVRSLVLPCVESMNHGWCYEPGVRVRVKADARTVLDADLPQGAWQDDMPLTLALDESTARKYSIELTNAHPMRLDRLQLSGAARKNNWESETGRSLRSIERTAALPEQSADAFVKAASIVDISAHAISPGVVRTVLSPGNWTVLRIGHVNSGRRNGPAPAEGTGWECNKLSREASRIHFDGYIGRLTGSDGPLTGGMLDGMLMDSWECGNQTWTADMESDFALATGYDLRPWLPALFGYVVGDHETTTRFLRDWRSTINGLMVNNFYGNMAEIASSRGLTVAYETSIGDVVPGDILEYFKYADVPMCEFWQPMADDYVGAINFKPIRPTASAARMYGKGRVAAEAFTSFVHTWDETPSMLKAVADANMAQGVSHLVFHTYTHNPQTHFLPPGTSFGGQCIGTPFVRGQTWWPYMHSFTDYLARCSYMFETARPVADVLWYLGDEMDHKPNQNVPFPEGFNYDYCNPDVLVNRLSVSDGRIVTPEGLSYGLMWIPENRRMLPETVEALQRLVEAGATIVANAPLGAATLRTDDKSFARAVKKLWSGKRGVHKKGKGFVMEGMTLDEALTKAGLKPDVLAGEAMWSHFRTDSTDRYFVAAPKGRAFAQTAEFACDGYPELWNPVDGTTMPLPFERRKGRTAVNLSLPAGGSCFVVFSDKKTEAPAAPAEAAVVALNAPWRLSFPEGWGAPDSVTLAGLMPWCEIDGLSDEAKAFSGTVCYTTEFNIDSLDPQSRYMLDLGEVAHIAEVSVNGRPAGVLWCEPYTADLGAFLREGANRLEVKVTGTWFNRLAYDAGLPESERKTWTLRRPGHEEPLRASGLLGPVSVKIFSKKI